MNPPLDMGPLFPDTSVVQSEPNDGTATSNVSGEGFALDEMNRGHIAAARELIARAMNPDEARWAETTFRRHFELQLLGITDGRQHFVHLEPEGLAGLVGLHHYEWGPPENVWLGWFAVDPAFQGRGFGTRLFRAARAKGRLIGYRKLFVETYSSQAFGRARSFYQKQGLVESGRVAQYLPDGTDMIVYSGSL